MHVSENLEHIWNYDLFQNVATSAVAE